LTFSLQIYFLKTAMPTKRSESLSYGRRNRETERPGVPNKKIFEHLEATIAEAIPLYELCKNVLSASQ
jgi:hypothetical protein